MKMALKSFFKGLFTGIGKFILGIALCEVFSGYRWFTVLGENMQAIGKFLIWLVRISSNAVYYAEGLNSFLVLFGKMYTSLPAGFIAGMLLASLLFAAAKLADKVLSGRKKLSFRTAAIPLKNRAILLARTPAK